MQRRAKNISSKTITFAPERVLPNGIGLEVAVEWPALRPGLLRMELILHGYVTSADPSATTLKIVRYKFQPNDVGR